VHFLDAWTRLSLLDQLRLAAPAALMVAAIALPGRRLAATIALALAPATALSGAIAGPWPVAASWAGLWLIIAFTLQRFARPGIRHPVERAGGLESTLIGLVLGAPLFALLALAIARQDLSVEATRAATSGLLYETLGLIHLMVRRHVVRSALGWAFAGFGLQVLEGAARTAVPETFAPPRLGLVLATAFVCALVVRLGLTRARVVGSAWLSDAHDLHD
jgi:hypothetical protein